MIVKGSEVFKKLINRSIRGIVANIDEETMMTTIVWSVDGESLKEKVPYDELAGSVFEDEKELIRACGKDLVELAPPRKIYLKSAKDFYGADIAEGDFVIAMADEALAAHLEGFVKSIYYLSTMGYRTKFIELVDEDGRTVAGNCNATMFSVPERFMAEAE